jgi:hypothetical protein
MALILTPFRLKKDFSLFIRFFGIGFIFLLVSCAQEDRHAEGRELAKLHCATCHLFPDPEILPRRIWGEKIIPNMGLKMGMSYGSIFGYDNPVMDSEIDLIPSMPQEDWDKIVNYYIHTSTNKTPSYSIKDQKASSLFDAHVFVEDSINLVTMTDFDNNKGELFLGDANTSSLITFNSDGKLINSEKLESPPVKILFKDSLKYVLTIGNLNPSDEPKGKLQIGNNTIDKLIRPVDFLVKDMNLDGYDDIFICNYGNNVGDFSLYENLKNGSYNKQIIHPLSGAIKVETANMDADKDDEFIVLFAQEHESIMIWDYENGIFTGKQVAQFQPTFGSVDFQLRDMDGDGDADIVLGNGDNADYSLVLKNFHGVRVLLNLGNKEFSESYFFPMHGVSKVKVEDFDMDGDMDILAISNFGYFSNPKFKSVQLLINEGGLKFTPQYISALPDFRWQTMDVSDYDNDGDLDVFLGSFNLNLGPEESDTSNKENITWVKLENKTK